MQCVRLVVASLMRDVVVANTAESIPGRALDFFVTMTACILQIC